MLSKTETVKLEIRLNANWWNNPPQCKIYLDNNVILQSTTITGPQTIEFKGELDEGEHAIRIALFNKNGLIETIKEGDKIVKDQLLCIEGISIDGIDLGYIVYSDSEFIADGANEKIVKIQDLGVNGVWELKFSVPTYMWLLEKL